jgi:ABC-type Fe3+-hydroxamate transport system substrate-binding protein
MVIEMNKKLIATVIVAIVIVSSVGVGWILMNNDSKSSASTVEGALEVYGNANGDYVIDSEDKGLIQKIIEQNLDWETDYPFADANYDGTVDSNDVTYVQSIMDATAENRILVYHNNECFTDRYVASTMYPVIATMSSTNETTIITLKALGLRNEIKATSYSDSASRDPYIFEEYFDIMTSEYRMGNSGAAVNVDTASNFVTEYGCTAYICPSAVKLSNSDAVEGAGIDIIQIADAMSDIGDYTSGLLLLGFLFGTSDNDYQETAIKLADWFNEYYADLEEHLESIYNGTVSQVSGIASTMVQYVAVKGSSNTDIIEQAGLYCPLTDTVASGATTLKYIGGTDTWLNYIDVDILIGLRGSSYEYGWSWFDKDYTTCPDNFKQLLNNFSSLECCQNDSAVIVSTLMPAPLKSGVVAQCVYPELFEDGWIESYLTEFFMEFWGWSADDCDGLRYYMTQTEILGS